MWEVVQELAVPARPPDPRLPGQLPCFTPALVVAPLGVSPPQPGSGAFPSPLLPPTQVNDWQRDWVTFYARQRIQPQMDLVEQRSGDREARELWAALQVSVHLPTPSPRPVPIMSCRCCGQHSHLGLGQDGRRVCLCTNQAPGATLTKAHVSLPHASITLLRLHLPRQLKIPDLFRDLDIVPALLHGDLWGGNVAEDSSGPIIFDPASFYGHSEYELAIAGMFGGFSSAFYSAYHSKIPKAPGFEKRLKLYQLFHYLNHWNHFGSGYRGSSLSIMRNLIT